MTLTPSIKPPAISRIVLSSFLCFASTLVAYTGPTSEPDTQWDKGYAQVLQLKREQREKQAIPQARNLLQKARQDDNAHRVASSAQLLGDLLVATRQSDKALPYYQESVTNWRLTGQPNPILYGVATSSLAHLHQAAGRFPEAAAGYHDALRILEAGVGKHHPKLSSVLNGMGGLYLEQDEWSKAESAFVRSLAIRENALSAKDPALATCLINLATVYQKQLRFPSAKRALRRARTIQRRAFGAQHPRVVPTLRALAKVHLAESDDEAARSLLQEALQIQERHLELRHPERVETLNLLGALHKRSGEFEEAEHFYLRALKIAEDFFGKKDARTGVSYHNLGVLFADQGKLAEAEPLFEKAIATRADRPGDPSLENYQSHLAALYRVTGRLDEANALSPTESEESVSPSP